nr:hypothetical protein [Mycoplasmopsis bovis]
MLRLSQYSNEEIVKILQNSKKKLKVETDNEVLMLLAKYSRNTPRIANHLLKRAYDFSLKNNQNIIDAKTTYLTFKHLELFDLGLNKEHIEYLSLLSNSFYDKFVSIECNFWNSKYEQGQLNQWYWALFTVPATYWKIP